MTDQDPSAPRASDGFSTSSATTDDATQAEADRGSAAREWLAQLQSMIENLATLAAPVAREIGAKAAELAAVAAEKAGPIAAKAAEATADAGTRFAERSRSLAIELRKELEGEPPAPAEPAAATEPATPAAPATPAEPAEPAAAAEPVVQASAPPVEDGAPGSRPDAVG